MMVKEKEEEPRKVRTAGHQIAHLGQNTVIARKEMSAINIMHREKEAEK